jgi:hypothetical protein
MNEIVSDGTGTMEELIVIRKLNIVAASFRQKASTSSLVALLALLKLELKFLVHI